MAHRKSKWDQYREEAREIAKQDPLLTPKAIALLICDKYNLEFENSFRILISRMRTKMGLPQFHGSRQPTVIDESQAKGDDPNKNSWEVKEDSATWEYEGTRSIQTLDEALAFCKADMKKWEVKTWRFNSWDVTMNIPTFKDGKKVESKPVTTTNYQVRVEFKPKDNSDEIAEDFKNQLEQYLKKRDWKAPASKNVGVPKKKIGVVPLADLHIGAYIRGLIKTQDFDIKRVASMLAEAAGEINSQQFSEVHISIVGDLIESFTGKNHENSFKSIGYGQYGMNVVIMAFEILEVFFSMVNNLTHVYMVSGNHDRHSASNKLDVKGDILQGVAYFCKRVIKGVKFEYDPLVLAKKIDGICYIFTHGHHGLAKKAIEKIILDYGVQGMYNVVLQGHWHARGKKKPVVTNVETIQSDSAMHIGITLPSFFTGNFYSESLGYTSNPGFVMMWAKSGRPYFFDVPLIS